MPDRDLTSYQTTLAGHFFELTLYLGCEPIL